MSNKTVDELLKEVFREAGMSMNAYAVNQVCYDAIEVMKAKRVDQHEVCMFVNCHKLLESGDEFRNVASVLGHIAEEHGSLRSAEALLALTECIHYAREHVKFMCVEHGITKMFPEEFKSDAIDHNLRAAKAIYDDCKKDCEKRARNLQ